MIIGVLIRTILEFCRRRGTRVPDISRLRRRPPRIDVTRRVADRLATLADDATKRRGDR